MKGPALAALMAFSSVVAGCEVIGLPTPAAEVCAAHAPAYDGQVVGSFNTTVSALRALEPLPAEPARWPNLPDDHQAVLCYIDGRVAKSPPGGEPFDRAVVAVVDQKGELIMAGYRDRLPIRAP